MKNSAIIKIVAWSIVAVTLTVILVVVLNGKIFGADSGFTFFNIDGLNIDYDNEEDYTIGSGNISADDSKTIQNLDINWISGDAIVKICDGDEIKISEESSEKIEEDDQLRYLVDNDKLIIQYSKPRQMFGFSIGLKKEDYKKTLTVEIPKRIATNFKNVEFDVVSSDVDMSDITAKDIDIDSVSGEININNVTATDFDVDTTSGNVKCEDCSLDNVNIDTVSGKYSHTGRAESIDVDTTSGDVTVNLSNCPSEIEVDGISADVDINIPSDSQFTASFDAVSGELSSDFDTKMSKGNYVCGNGDAEFSFDTCSGEVTIGKSDE